MNKVIRFYRASYVNSLDSYPTSRKEPIIFINEKWIGKKFAFGYFQEISYLKIFMIIGQNLAELQFTLAFRFQISFEGKVSFKHTNWAIKSLFILHETL